MRINKSVRLIVDVFIVVTVMALAFVVALSMNVLPGSQTGDRIFSKENIKETIITLAIISAIVIPIRAWILKDKEKK